MYPRSSEFYNQGNQENQEKIRGINEYFQKNQVLFSFNNLIFRYFQNISFCFAFFLFIYSEY